MRFKPAKSTILTNDFFVKNKVKTILIPGIGYGRNAKTFRDNGMLVTGIEISKTHFGNAGLFEIEEVIENDPFHLIKCMKESTKR